MLKNIGFKISVVVIVAMIVGLLGYNHYTENKNAESLSKEQVTTPTETKPENTKKNNIIAIGDGFVNGQTNFVDALSNDANANVTQFGGVSDTSTDVAIRANALNVYVNNITIPSSVSPVAITLYNQQGEALDALHGKGTNFDNVTIGGIEGQLSYNQQDKKLYFERHDAGKETKVTKLTQVEGQKVEFNANDSYVFFVGQNDPYYKGSIFKTINNINAIF